MNAVGFVCGFLLPVVLVVTAVNWSIDAAGRQANHERGIMKFEIKSRRDSSILFSIETDTLRMAVELAVKSGADLGGAYLGGAYLGGANLGGANLGSAYLGGADLRSAYLGGADLRGADLRGADLRGAYLRGADLRGADLRGADLRGADLRGAYLGDAYLGGAYLEGAYLGGADLGGANLGSAYLGSAYLGGADLRGAKGLDKFPIQIGGHKHWLITTPDGQLQIGCHVYPFDYWLANAEPIARIEGYSELDIAIYKLHIEHVAKIARLLWNSKPEREQR